MTNSFFAEVPISNDLLIRLQNTHTLDDVGAVLGDIQKLYGFLCYYVLDMSRLNGKEPVSLVFPSNVSTSLIKDLEEGLSEFVSRHFMQVPEILGPRQWDLAELEADGTVLPHIAAPFHASRLVRGVGFLAFDMSGAPRMICFSGDRPYLTLEEGEQLSVLMEQTHAQLTIIGQVRREQKEPLTCLERQILFLSVNGESFDRITAQVGLSSRTITYLIDSICTKMEVSTIEHAVAVTLRRKLAHKSSIPPRH
jgi:DNA-binding CsgD family transcriptional regulator